MAIARVSGQTLTVGESSSATSVGAVLNQNIVAGNFIGVMGGYRKNFVSIADGLGNSYGTDNNFAFAIDDREVVIGSCKKVATGGACTVTLTQDAAGRIACFAMEYDGFGSGGAQLEDTATKNEEVGTTSVETNAADLASAEGLALMVTMDSFDGVPYTYGSSFVKLGESNDAVARSSSGDRALSAAGSYEGTATTTGSIAYASALALYGPVPAGPGVNAPKQRTKRPHPMSEQYDGDDEGHFNELDVRNWWREAVPV